MATLHPLEELRDEEKQLEQWDKDTKEKYCCGYYESWNL